MEVVHMSFISYLINGISLGSVYALIALGYTMVYGIAKMLNFAHGDVIMVGAFITYTMCSTMGLSPVIGVLAAVIACTLLGMAIEKVAYKPLRKASSPLAVLITAIGVSYLLQNVALLIFGANAKAFTSVVSVPAVKLADGQINITGETIVTIVTCLIIMAGLMLFINKTKAGQAMLAVSEDKGAAQLKECHKLVDRNRKMQGHLKNKSPVQQPDHPYHPFPGIGSILQQPSGLLRIHIKQLSRRLHGLCNL